MYSNIQERYKEANYSYSTNVYTC